MTAWYGKAGNLKRSNGTIVSHQWFLCPFAVDCVSRTKEQHRYPHPGQQTHTVLILRLPKPLKWNYSGCFNHTFAFVVPLPNIMRMMCQINGSIVVEFIIWIITTLWHIRRLLATSILLLLCVSFSLEAPSPIPAASLFWACHHIYFVLHLCVAFWLSSHYCTLHLCFHHTCESVYMWSIVLCLFKYGASIEFSASKFLH